LAAAWHKLVKRFHGFAPNGELLGAPLQRISRQELSIDQLQAACASLGSVSAVRLKAEFSAMHPV
jgi:formylmethanofuran dehydrogenase subunit E